VSEVFFAYSVCNGLKERSALMKSIISVTVDSIPDDISCHCHGLRLRLRVYHTLRSKHIIM